MFVVWRGLGILVLVLPIVFIAVGGLLINYLLGDGCYEDNSNWLIPVLLLLSAVSIYTIGYKVNKKPERILIDKETNEEVILKDKHDFFWIPMHYFGYIIGLIAVTLYLTENNLI